MNIEGLDKIYVIHYIKLKERKEYLKKRLKELGLEKYVIWVISINDDNFTKKEFAMYDGSKEALEERKKVLGTDNIASVGKIDKVMVLQQIRILKKIAKRKNNKISVIFEDDVILSDDFPKKLYLAIIKLERLNWDICYSDKGALFKNPIKSNDEIILYRPENNSSNTTGSYLINPKSASKIVKVMKKFSLSIDMELTYIQRKYNLNVYWTIPFLTRQGSIENIYKSNVRKGSISGNIINLIEKTEKISPYMADVLADLSNFIRSTTYSSKTLIWIKGKIKAIIKL